MNKAIVYIVSTGMIWLLVSAISPYWNQYAIKSDLKAAALYGTKHSIDETRNSLTETLRSKGDDFTLEQLHIEKDENRTVSIRLTYEDVISFFGLILKELEFTLVVTERETKEYL